MSTVAIQVSHVTHEYHTFKALSDISFDVPKGVIIGVLGPNGAGKSTLIKSLVGAITPSLGNIRILGANPIKNKWAIRSHIGYMPQDPSLYEDLTVLENIAFFARGSGRKVVYKDIAYIIDFTELTDRMHTQVYTLSGGLKKRVSLACALVNNPELLFLDEPTAAVDPYVKIKSWDLFRRFVGEGKTILVSTHLMDEALLCDYLLILREGKILAFDTPGHIMEKGNAILTIHEGKIQNITIKNTPEALADTLKAYGLRDGISEIHVKEQSIEDIIISLTKKEL